MDLKEKRCLIAFYSRKGHNYVNGNIVNLEIGNTEVIAKMINEIIGGDIFYINTKKPYPTDNTKTTEVTKHESKCNSRPELTDHVPDMNL